MNKKNAENAKEKRREQMIEFIVRAIQQMDDGKLSNVYHLVLHIK